MLGLVPNNTISENDKVIIKDLEKLNYSNDIINVLILENKSLKKSIISFIKKQEM